MKRGGFDVMQKCKKCGIENPKKAEFFRPAKDMKSGFRSSCRDCEKAYNRRSHELNREINNEKSRQKRKDNPEKAKAYYEDNKEASKKYYDDNKEAINKYGKQWYEKNKEEINRKRKETWRAEHPKEEIPEGMKKCSTCKSLKPATNKCFSLSKKNKDGFNHRCKQCRREAEYWIDVEKAKSKQKVYYEENKEKINVQTTNYTRRKYKEDLNFRLLNICRSRVTLALKGKVKSKNTLELIGGSAENLKKHLESQFTEGMTWDNHGKWHIDHIKPCAVFDFTVKGQQHECFHYTNLQPLWAEENMRKSAKYEESV